MNTWQIILAIIIVGLSVIMPIYLSKRKFHEPDGIDDLIGFNPNCIH